MKPSIRLAKPDAIEVTLTITLPVHAWLSIRDGGNWNPFREAVNEMLDRVNALNSDDRP